MYIMNHWMKFVLIAVLSVGYMMGWSAYDQALHQARAQQALHQFQVPHYAMRETSLLQNYLYLGGWGMIAFITFLLFKRDLHWQVLKRALAKMGVTSLVLLALCCASCRQPFEPVKLEIIKSNEEAFLLPLTADGKQQQSTNTEEYLKQNLVYSKQVQIPQQWVPLGYESWFWNGEWRDAALLIKVDKSPITREWTADPNSGTSNKNEAVWVMTSDQVEFSTGWTITARIEGREDAVRFLYNYPNGSLTAVMDTEVRSKLQATFGLAVTDLPMDTLRRAATPIIHKVTASVTEFFKLRGITITNIGITGGFIYKDKSIMETMVRVFNAEQAHTMAIAATRAQEEQNKAVILKAQGEADALLRAKTAEAHGVKVIADARHYAASKAQEDLRGYGLVQQYELQRELLTKWDGHFPRYFLSSNGQPNMLLQLPDMHEVESPQ